jgi:hypothetical protein
MRRPSHQTIAAYLALFVALATGGAYAADKIGSPEIANNSIRSVDLKNRKAVRGKDVKRNSLKGKQIKERTLDASGLVPVAGSERGTCNPESTQLIDCAAATIVLPTRSRVFAIATGGQRSEDMNGASALCEIRVDGNSVGDDGAPGEALTDNTSGGATNGFARTYVSSEPLPAGKHRVALSCSENAADVVIQDVSLAVLGIGTGKR